MKKPIKISAAKLKAMTPKRRQRSAQKTKVVKSKRKYDRKDKWFTPEPYVDGWKGID
jgi:hypothetical protein